MFDDPDLMAEWLATPSLNSRQRKQLEELGVTREAILRAGGLGWARVSTIGGRCYTPRDAGEVKFIVPAWAGPVPSIYQAVEHPVLADLLAWHPEEPTRWWYRIGGHGAVLGADNLDLAHVEGLPISFALTPLDWLRGDCRGAVLLDLYWSHWQSEDEADAAAATTEWWGAQRHEEIQLRPAHRYPSDRNPRSDLLAGPADSRAPVARARPHSDAQCHDAIG